jgi:hypothetical protein
MSSRRIGNYQITDYIGGGGFGSVFRAEDVNSPGRIVAIKELHKKHTRNATIKQRFFQEAVAMARLDHPNLPRLFTFGEDGGCYYLVMEFLSGRLLSDEINERGAIAPARAVAIAAQVLEALAYAHRNGIIHRDLKPDNIMLLEPLNEGRVKVLDFGIARMVGGENLTLTGEGFGTPAYMSPERIGGVSGNDPRIDLYSVGIILYEMLSGKTPFESTASDPVVYWMEMRAAHENHPLPSLAELGVPTHLETIIRRSAAKKIEERYASAEEMLEELKRSEQGAAERAPSSALARLSLTTQPAEADLYIDELARGRTDPRGKLLCSGLSAGVHSVRVVKDGYTDYRINVALEAGRQTDLQVALSARSTVVAAPAPPTAAGGFDTARFPGGDEADTALLVLDSLPAGANVFVGGRSVALAGEDGKATIRLALGDHDISIASPSGTKVNRRITLTGQDSGAPKTVTLSMERETSGVPPTRAVGAGARSTGKKWATVAALILFLAIAGIAAYVLVLQRSRPDPSNAGTAEAAQTPPGQEAPQAADAGPPEPAAAAGEKSNSKTDSTANPAGNPSGELNKKLEEAQAENAKLEKKLAEEKKQAEQRAKDEAAKASSSPPVQAPPVPPPAAQQPADPVPATAPGEACLMVALVGPDGEPASQFRVQMVQTDGDKGITFNGRTNPKGRVVQCGLVAGRQVRVTVFGPRGALLGSRTTTLTPGRNFIEIRGSSPVVRPGADETITPRPRRKRPF